MRKFVSFILLFVIFFSSVNIVFANIVDDKNNFFKEKAKIYSNNRSEYLTLYNKYKSTCQKDSEGCTELKEQVLEKIKIYFISSFEAIISYAEALKARVENADADSSLKQASLDDIQKIVDLFREKIKSVEAIKSAEEVKLLSQDMKALWLEKEAIILKIRASILLWSIEENNNKLNDFSAGLNNYLLNLSKEYDVSDIQARYNLNKDKINELNKRLDVLKISIDGINKSNISDYKKIKQAFTSYKNATQEITKEFKLIVDALTKNDFKEISSDDFKDFYIKGEGQIIITGNFEISGDIGDNNNLGKIDALNTDTINTFEEGSAIKSGDKTVYSGVKRVSIKSKDKIIITSNYLDLIIKGKGEISIKGDGLYKSGNDGTWSDISADGLEESI